MKFNKKLKFISSILFFAITIPIVAPILAKEITFSEGTKIGVSLTPIGDMVAIDLQGMVWAVNKGGSTLNKLHRVKLMTW